MDSILPQDIIPESLSYVKFGENLRSPVREQNRTNVRIRASMRSAASLNGSYIMHRAHFRGSTAGNISPILPDTAQESWHRDG